MNKFPLRGRDSDTQRTPRAFAGTQIFHGILTWLTALIRFPTEEEQQAAGIFPGNRHTR